MPDTIQKKIFIDPDRAVHSARVCEWFAENASEYFDSITKDAESNTITCSKGGTKYLTFLEEYNSRNTVFRGYSSVGTMLLNTNTASQASTVVIPTIYKTSHGLMILGHSGERLFITLDTNGELIFAGKMYKTATLINNGFVIYRTAVESENTAGTKINEYFQSESTTFSEVLTPSGKKAEHLFYLPFVQYPEQISIINDGSKRYVTDGYFALEE